MEAENVGGPDLGQGGLDTGDNPGPGNFKMPSVDELLEALEKMDGLTEENKQEIRDSLANQAKGGIPNFGNQTGRAPPDLLLLFVFLAIILFVFVFFGYKLYRALTERDRRKEEKRRLKEQKKKK